MDSKGLENYINRKEKQLIETYNNLDEVRKSVYNFLKKATFPLKPQTRSKRFTSESHEMAFLIKEGKVLPVHETLEIYSKDSIIDSTKVINYHMARRGEDHDKDINEGFTGKFTLRFVKRPEKDYRDMLEDEALLYGKEPNFESKEHDPRRYLKKREWAVEIKDECNIYPIIKENDILVLRNKAIEKFINDYFPGLKKYRAELIKKFEL